jgi:polyvinyl alcohol dehydrogenase (cytochrome)
LTLEVLEDRTVPTGHGPVSHPVDVVSSDPNDWPMYNHDVAGTRFNPAEHQVGPENVGGLKVQWTFPTRAVVAGTPAVVGEHIYAADASGTVYALNRDGSLLWSSQVAGPVTASVLVTNRSIIFGDLSGFIYGLDVTTGALRWKVRPNAHPTAAVFSSPTMVGNDVAIGVASVEEVVAAKIPGYQPSFRGSLVLLDPSDGQVLWQTYTVTDAESSQGGAGAGIWSTPAYDRESNTIYVSTGNQYSKPNVAMSDALIALNASNGRVRWVNQFNHSDAWNFSFPPTPDEADFDFGDSPKVYRVDGREVVGAGQKSGFYHVVDAATGADVNPGLIQVQHGGQLSGLFANGAEARGVAFANTSYWPSGFSGGAPRSGSLVAIAGDGRHELWAYPTPLPDLSGVAVANNVVYFQSIDGNLYALDARTGAELAQVATGGQSSGPAVSRGHLYLGIGNAFALLADLQHPPPGAIIALGAEDRDDSFRPGEDQPGDDRPSGGPVRFDSGPAIGHPLLSIAAELSCDLPTTRVEFSTEVPGGQVSLVPQSPSGELAWSLPGGGSADQLARPGRAAGKTVHEFWDAAQDWLKAGEGEESFLTDWFTARS